MRGLRDIPHFKSSEFRTWLLYIGPVLLADFVELDVYFNFLRLSFAIRSLLETDIFLEECDLLLNSFCAFMADIDSNEQTFNLHSLRHLTWQVRNLGPLFTTSCFAFESAHHLLTSTFSGKVNHLKLLAERYLTNKRSLHAEVHTRRSEKLSCNWMKSTEYTKRLHGEGKRVYDHCFIKGIQFDSEVYTRSQANSFVALRISDKILLGQVICYHDNGELRQLSYRKAEIIEEIKCPDGIKLPVFC